MPTRYQLVKDAFTAARIPFNEITMDERVARNYHVTADYVDCPTLYLGEHTYLVFHQNGDYLGMVTAEFLKNK